MMAKDGRISYALDTCNLPTDCLCNAVTQACRQVHTSADCYIHTNSCAYFLSAVLTRAKAVGNTSTECHHLVVPFTVEV